MRIAIALAVLITCLCGPAEAQRIRPGTFLLRYRRLEPTGNPASTSSSTAIFCTLPAERARAIRIEVRSPSLCLSAPPTPTSRTSMACFTVLQHQEHMAQVTPSQVAPIGKPVMRD